MPTSSIDSRRRGSFAPGSDHRDAERSMAETGMGEVQKPEITTWSENHPVMQYVSVHDVAIERASRIDPGNLTVIAASKQTPLIVASDKPKWVMLTFDLDSSDFPFHVGFPSSSKTFCRGSIANNWRLKRSPGIVDVPLRECTDPDDRRQNDSFRTATRKNRFPDHRTRTLFRHAGRRACPCRSESGESGRSRM